ncbi:DUF2274 domain-containing protein [Galenea microaerophila]
MSIKLNLSKKEKNVRKSIAFKETQAKLLDKYMKYLDSMGYEADVSQIVGQVVERFLTSDKDFKAWLKKKEKEEKNKEDSNVQEQEETNESYEPYNH